MATILWVEDQSHWIDKFSPILRETDFDGTPNRLQTCKFPQAARQWITTADDGERPDIAILDARMCGHDDAGFSVARALQGKWQDVPVIYFSEHSGTDIEREALTELGAIDFIAKHQRNVEQVLCWRIRAALRQRAIANGAAATDDTLRSGELLIDLNTWEVYWRGVRLMNPGNSRRPLPPTPRKILRCLVERSPRPVNTAQIANWLDNDEATFTYANYRQHIRTLRRSFDIAAGGDESFMTLCREGHGIVTFGDDQAYLWKTPAA